MAKRIVHDDIFNDTLLNSSLFTGPSPSNNLRKRNANENTAPITPMESNLTIRKRNTNEIPSSSAKPTQPSLTVLLEDTRILHEIDSAVIKQHKILSPKASLDNVVEGFVNSLQSASQSKRNRSSDTTLNLTELFRSNMEEKDDIFDKIENTIYEFGANHSASLLRGSQPKCSALTNDSFADFSVRSLLKNALVNNDAEFSQQINNATLVETQQQGFVSYGEFYGLPDVVKDLIRTYKGVNELYEWQEECLNLESLRQRKNLVYALPTSGGKTLVAEILILREILCRRKNVLFILPYVAIVQEKVWALSPFAVALQFLVEEYAAGRGNYPPRTRRRKNSVYVATIEKALGLFNSLLETQRTDELGLIVVDELHLMGEEKRGSVLEELLAKVLYTNPNIQIIGMSATIGNLEEVCQFLNAEQYTKNFRPVELIEYVKCDSELATIDYKAKDQEDVLIFERHVNYKYSREVAKIDPDHLGGLVMDVIPNGSVLIFCRSKQNCENVAILLCKVISPNLREVHKEGKQLIKEALRNASGTLCSKLNITIDFGIAYHHSGLTSEERRLIEEGFRQGILHVICCTSTLAAGVNLPAQRVIIRNPYIGMDFINLSRYKQMVGRAGRAGFGEKGDSFMIVQPNELERVRTLLLTPMDEVVSTMADNIRQFLLSCISLNIATTKAELEELIGVTLMSIQSERLRLDIKRTARAAIKDLYRMGALEIDELRSPSGEMNNEVSLRIDDTLNETSHNGDDNRMRFKLSNTTRLQISKMGKAAIKSGLDLKKAHVLYADLVEAQGSLVLFTGLHLMYLVTPYDISEQIKPVNNTYYTIYTQLSQREIQTARVLGFNEAVACKLLTNRRITEIPQRILNRFYVTLILYDLWNEMPIYDVSLKYEVNRGIIQNLMMSASTFASNVYHFCEVFEEFWAFSLLIKGMCDRLSHCCIKELLPLMALPCVKQSRAKQLYQAGYKNLQSVAKANPEDLMNCIEFMSRKLANQLIAAAKLILLERVENLREEAEDVLDGVNI